MAWRIPEELMIFGTHGKHEKADSEVSGEVSSDGNRVDKLSSKNEGQVSKMPKFSFLFKSVIIFILEAII